MYVKFFISLKIRIDKIIPEFMTLDVQIHDGVHELIEIFYLYGLILEIE